MIIVTSLKQKPFQNSDVIEDMIRLKYLSFKDMIDSLDYVIDNYIKNIDNEKINLTKKYNLSKKKFNPQKFLNGKITRVKEIKIPTKKIEKSHFSKNIHKLRSREESNKIELGLHMHEIFEYFDFQKLDYSNLNEFEKKKVEAFVSTGIMDNQKNIYKEYEFVYQDDNEYHGIIDLLIEKENENIIVDYKLKNTDDKEYIKQLKGYKKYIEKITEKDTKIYLYSILDENLKELK